MSCCQGVRARRRRRVIPIETEPSLARQLQDSDADRSRPTRVSAFCMGIACSNPTMGTGAARRGTTAQNDRLRY